MKRLFLLLQLLFIVGCTSYKYNNIKYKTPHNYSIYVQQHTPGDLWNVTNNIVFVDDYNVYIYRILYQRGLNEKQDTLLWSVQSLTCEDKDSLSVMADYLWIKMDSINVKPPYIMSHLPETVIRVKREYVKELDLDVYCNAFFSRLYSILNNYILSVSNYPLISGYYELPISF